MKYKVVIRKCDDLCKARKIAEKLAASSATGVEEVYKIITAGSVCILKDAPEKEAIVIKKTFESLGASVFVSSMEDSGLTRNFIQDDQDEIPGRILSEQEFILKLNQRPDILSLEKDSRLRTIELMSLVTGVACGIFLSTYEISAVMPDFLENIREDVPITISEKDVVIAKEQEVVKKNPVEIKKNSEKRTIRKTGFNSPSSPNGGGGDIKARVTAKGVLGIISGQIKSKSVASADLFGKGGFSNDIDALLAGVGGLKSYGSSGVGRRGVTGIGFGTGYGNGFGGGSGGIDDVFNNLTGGNDLGVDLTLKSRQVKIKVDIPQLSGHAFVGGRSKTEILQVVMQNIRALRHAYNKRLHQKPGLSGKVTVKFGIDDSGRVLFVQVIESTMGDSEIETAIVERIRRWVFAKIDKPGDITEVVYPFVFSL